MARTGLVVAIGALLLPAACAKPAAGGPAAPANQVGVQGRTTADGGCAVVRQGTPCPDMPLSARINVTPVDGTATVVAVVSDADGRFRIPLTPDRYRLTPTNLTGALHPASSPQDVDVRPRTYTTVTVSFDSAIRHRYRTSVDVAHDSPAGHVASYCRSRGARATRSETAMSAYLCQRGRGPRLLPLSPTPRSTVRKKFNKTSLIGRR